MIFYGGPMHGQLRVMEAPTLKVAQPGAIEPIHYADGEPPLTAEIPYSTAEYRREVLVERGLFWAFTAEVMVTGNPPAWLVAQFVRRKMDEEERRNGR
jgi:hypothetical protein